MVKNSPANAGDVGLIPGLGRSPGEGKGYPLQYSCLANPMGRGAWQATVWGPKRVRQSRATEIYIYLLFQIIFHYRLLQDIECSSLCHTVGPCCLSILYRVVCICYPCSHLSPLVTINLFSISVNLTLFYK